MPAGLEPFSPSSQDRWDVAKAGHLLRRAGFGPLPSEIALAVQVGLDKAVDALFAFPTDPPAPPSFSEIRPAEARVDDMIAESIRTKTKPRDNPELRAAYEEVNRAHARA